MADASWLAVRRSPAVIAGPSGKYPNVSTLEREAERTLGLWQKRCRYAYKLAGEFRFPGHLTFTMPGVIPSYTQWDSGEAPVQTDKDFSVATEPGDFGLHLQNLVSCAKQYGADVWARRLLGLAKTPVREPQDLFAWCRLLLLAIGRLWLSEDVGMIVYLRRGQRSAEGLLLRPDNVLQLAAPLMYVEYKQDTKADDWMADVASLRFELLGPGNPRPPTLNEWMWGNPENPLADAVAETWRFSRGITGLFHPPEPAEVPNREAARRFLDEVMSWCQIQSVGKLTAMQVASILKREMHDPEKRIWSELDGRALKKESLAAKLDIDPRQLYRPGYLGDLKANCLVRSDRKLGGYYRPDSPPA